jgi:TatD DNase family protein
MLLIDVHAHMDLEGYEQYGGADKVIDECKKNNVAAIVANGVNIESNRKTLEIAKKHDIVKVALGIYPTHCLEMLEENKQKEFDEELKFIEDQIKHKKCIAIGEVGLEYKEIKNITEKQKDMQKECLKKFCEISLKYDVPIIIHTRGAETETVEFLEKIGMKNKKVIMHCYSGRKHTIQKIRDNGWFFSIPCNLDRSEHFQGIVKEVPLQQLFTETDAPYLSPIPGKTNRPDNVKYTIKKIAQIKQMTEEEVANIIYNNYQRMFL